MKFSFRKLSYCCGKFDDTTAHYNSNHHGFLFACHSLPLHARKLAMYT